MKEGIHPKYRTVVFKDISTDFAFLTRSTINTKDTITWEDGNEYPLIKVEISSASHPFYTGKQKLRRYRRSCGQILQPLREEIVRSPALLEKISKAPQGAFLVSPISPKLLFMQYLLFEDQSHFDLLPLTFTRPVWDLRVGIDRIWEKWGAPPARKTRRASPSATSANGTTSTIPTPPRSASTAKCIPTTDFVEELSDLANQYPGKAIVSQSTNEVPGPVVQSRAAQPPPRAFSARKTSKNVVSGHRSSTLAPEIAIRFPTDIFQHNGACIPHGL